MKKLIFIFGWILIGVGGLSFLGFLGSNMEIPDGAQQINDYAFIQPLENGQMRLKICSRPFKMPFFSIQAPLADRRVVIHYYYPDQYFSHEILVESNSEGTALIIGYSEFDLREFNIQSLTSAELFFKAFSNRATPQDKVGVYLTENIQGDISWNNPLARGDLQKQITVTSGSPIYQEFTIDVTNATQTELGVDEIVTFGYYPENNNCMVQIVGDTSQIWPILTIDYTESSGGSTGGTSGGSTNTDNNTDSTGNTDTIPSLTGAPLPPTPDDSTSWILKWWPYLSIIIGIIMVAWSSNGRFYR